MAIWTNSNRSTSPITSDCLIYTRPSRAPVSRAERRRVQLRKAKKNAADPYRLISILLLLVALGLGALYALERLRQTL